MNSLFRRTIVGLVVSALGPSAYASQADSMTLTALPARIGVIDSAIRTQLPNTRPLGALAAKDLGPIAPDTKLTGIKLVFARSAKQEAELQTLIAAQLDPSSSHFHQWLTPETFAARFGMAQSDLDATSTWLRSQGFTEIAVNRSHNRLSFNGTATQVTAAFGATLHAYKEHDGSTSFAPSVDLSLPSALAANVLGITNLSTSRMRSQIVPHSGAPVTQAPAPSSAAPNFTDSQSGEHFMTPGDVATIYDVNRVYNNLGYTGAGQSIAIVGQSLIHISDIANFQSAIGQPFKAPNLVLVPDSGASAFNPRYSDDEVESDLDLEYSSAMAPGATIYFVYTGDDPAFGVLDSIAYAVDQDIASIISVSYGECEFDAGVSRFAQTNAVLAQAAAQGQTVLAAAGDAGSSGCQATELGVIFPGDSQYALTVGGTEFSASAVAVGNNEYWAPHDSTDVIASAKGYIPEQVWNDDAVRQTFDAGGGGESSYVTRPIWQKNSSVPGIAALGGSNRLLPDISLDSSPQNAGYVYCSSDTVFFQTGQRSSCTLGLRDAATGDLNIAGGTSFATPILAGLLALINQAKGYTNGQGVAASVIYSLASNPATYASAFHDITSGGNQCDYVLDCGTTAPTTTNYAAGPGFDEASGLGSLDVYNILVAWPAVSLSSAPSILTLTPATRMPGVNANDAIAVAVSGSSGTPAGTVQIDVDGKVVSTLNLSAGSATYLFSSTVAGEHVITAVYGGNGLYASSASTVSLTVGGSFTLSVPDVSITKGSSVTVAAKITPINGYTGTVLLDIAANQPGLSAACIGPASLNTTGVPITSTTTVNFTIYTSNVACEASGLVKTEDARTQVHSDLQFISSVKRKHQPIQIPLAFAVAGLLAVFGQRRVHLKKALRVPFGLTFLLILALTVPLGCSGAPSAATPIAVAPSTYLVTVTAYDSANPSLSSTTNFSVTVN